MKKILILLFCFIPALFCYGNHLKGGWIYYEYLGAGAAPNTVKYRINVKQYLECHSTAQQIDQTVFLGIFKNSDNLLQSQVTIPLSGTNNLNKTSFNPCISSPPEVCFRVDNYVTVVDLPSNSSGYTLAVQRCCRIAGIVNIVGSNSLGVSYTTTIPGTIGGKNFENNNSPQFAQKDTVAVCYNGNFTFDFSATDADQDSLVYAFCPGLVGGGPGPNQSRPDPPSNPPYSSVPYSSSYNGSSPMGPTVTVDSKTGLISGTAPGITGDYIVAVCAAEYRGGVKIGETKKEIHITVASCNLSAAVLRQPGYQLCDSATFTFKNELASANIISYTWNFGDIASGNSNTSSTAFPTHKYSDTGKYVIKLKVQSAAGCLDSTSSLVNVFPGFKPDFTYAGNCFQSAFQFTDKTTTRYGVVNSWSWDFGDLASFTDTSTLKNPNYKYPSPGIRTARLTATNSKGCIDTISKMIGVYDVPALSLPFKDTLICSIDTLTLHAVGQGNFTWKPAYNILKSNTANPLVYPKDTTTYVVTLTDNGCVTSAAVKVNVLNSISLNAGADTTICRSDSIIFKPISQGLQYQWTPSTDIAGSATIKNAIAKPIATTTYTLIANLGKCQSTDAIRVAVVPYPKANAGTDATICYGQQTPLTGIISGSSFTWTPSGTLTNKTTLTPIARPAATTSYVLSVNDTLGCPKTVMDTVMVTVIPHINAFAGNDTIIIANQPLQLNATGGDVYAWTPTEGLSNPSIPNPIATLGSSYDSVIYKVRVGLRDGCFEEDEIKIRLFKTGPDIFVPTAFTPNHDGKNDFLKPIPVAMKSIYSFNIYNRWGQLIYSSSSSSGPGWDGTFAGKEQATGTYVFTAGGIDYLGKTVIKKGTVVLIR